MGNAHRGLKNNKRQTNINNNENGNGNSNGNYRMNGGTYMKESHNNYYTKKYTDPIVNDEYKIQFVGQEQEMILHLETQELVQTTHFTYDEITMLRNHLATLDHIPPSTLTLNQPIFQDYLKTHSSSLYLLRLYCILDSDHKGYVNFSNIIHGLSILSQRATREEKYKLSFQLLDQDKKGYLTYDNIYQMISACIKEAQVYGYLNLCLNSTQIHEIIKSTFKEADLNQNESIEYNEYIQICDVHPGILEFITLDVSTLLHQFDLQKGASSSKNMLYSSNNPITETISRENTNMSDIQVKCNTDVNHSMPMKNYGEEENTLESLVVENTTTINGGNFNRIHAL